MGHLYFVMKTPEQPDRILVWDTRTLAIGRAPENDLTLEDDEVSRKHAQLLNEDGQYEIGDYRTGNGTFVNGKRVSQKARIKPGDVIAIGKLQMEFCEAEEHPATLGLKLDFASHLMTMGMLPQGSDAGATMLGLSDTAPPDGEDFIVEPERGAGAQAFVGGLEPSAGFQMRELDDSLNDMQFETDDPFELSEPDPGPPPPPPPETRPLEMELELEPTTPPSAPAQTPPPRTPKAPPRKQAPVAPPTGPAQTPAPAAAVEDPTERMRKLKMLHDEGLITDEEFHAKRSEILSAM